MGDSIQTAVDNSTSGDIIILNQEPILENIKIDKDNLIISSESEILMIHNYSQELKSCI